MRLSYFLIWRRLKMLNISPIFAKANKSGFTVIHVIDVCKWTPDGYYLINLNYHPQFIDQFTNFEMPIVYTVFFYGSFRQQHLRVWEHFIMKEKITLSSFSYGGWLDVLSKCFPNRNNTTWWKQILQIVLVLLPIRNNHTRGNITVYYFITGLLFKKVIQLKRTFFFILFFFFT